MLRSDKNGRQGSIAAITQERCNRHALSGVLNYRADHTQAFFAKVQNKLHFAIHGSTAVELIMQRADSTKTNMGLTSWEKGMR